MFCNGLSQFGKMKISCAQSPISLLHYDTWEIELKILQLPVTKILVQDVKLKHWTIQNMF